MGVDITIRQESLGRSSHAKCRGFRPESPELILHLGHRQRRGITLFHLVYPLESLPFPIEVVGNCIIEAQAGNRERYAVKLSVFRNSKQTKQRIVIDRWLTRDEYEQFKAKDRPPDSRTDSRWLALTTSDERKAICSSCPLHYPDEMDCEPRLFSYRELPHIRHHVANMFSTPPEIVYQQVAELIRGFVEIFPEAIKQNNTASSQEANFRRIEEQLIQKGFTESILPETPPLDRVEHTVIGDMIINGLFFRQPYEEPDGEETLREDFWVFGIRLEHFIKWLEKLLGVIEVINLSQKPPGQLSEFWALIHRYATSCRMAADNNLEISVSW